MTGKITPKSSPGHIETAHVLISRSCVNDCLFCATSDKRMKQKFPESAEVVRFIDKAHSAGIPHMIFSGLGEPTLDPNFEMYLGHAGKLGFSSIRLFTNGYNIGREKVNRWKKLGLTEVLLSIHGMKAGHDQATGRDGAFDGVMTALKIFTERGFSVSVNSCLTRSNLNEMTELINTLKQYPIKIHSLSFPEWCGNALDNLDEMVDYIEVADLLRDTLKKDDNITCFDNMPYCLINKSTIEQRGISSAAYLDGAGENVVRPIGRKLFHQKCYENSCAFLKKCAGFEPEYIKIRGWGEIPSRIDTFFSSISPQSKSRSDLASTINLRHSGGPRNNNLPNYYHKDFLTLIIRPTNSCNADCAYCSSYNPSKNKDKMSLKMLDIIYSKIKDYIDKAGIKNISILWHGGEPLLAGKEFFAHAWGTTSGWHDVKVKHLIQTNLLLADDEWLSLLKKYDVNIGTSADPIENIRIYKNGREQYHDWIDKLIATSRAGINIGLVFTATAAHLDKVELLHNFFKNIQMLTRKTIGVKVNPLYSAGKMAAGMANSLSITTNDYGKFLGNIWDLWENDNRPYPLSPFREWLDPGKLSCEFSGKCQDNFLAIDPDGQVFNCARFADSDNSFGNILIDDIDQILQHKSRMELIKRQEKLRANGCGDCSIWPLCHGGCPYFSEIYSGDIGHPAVFCDTYKYLFHELGIFGPIEK